MDKKKIAEKTSELADLFEGMSTLEMVLVLANFTATLICYSIDDENLRTEAADEFAGYVKAGLERAKKKGGGK